jgi:hypothetical protein
LRWPRSQFTQQASSRPILTAERIKVGGRVASLGPLTGGTITASFDLLWIFLIKASLLPANIIWAYFKVPKYFDERDE